jgi:hypothetical protein
MTKTQRRGRRIAMSDVEWESMARTESLCRVATAAADGSLHNSPMWFVYADGALWLYSLTKSRRWANLARNPSVSTVIDTGNTFADYRAVEVIGRAIQVGPAPWAGEEDSRLVEPARAFGAKYVPETGLVADGRHGWLRVDAELILTWDFGKVERAD